MECSQKQYIHSLFENKDYIKLYQTQTAVITEMLRIEGLRDFEDFLVDVNDLDEHVFGLYYSVVHGESLLIGGYDEDITKEVTAFLKQKLPEKIFNIVKEYLYDLYVDLGTRDTIEEKIDVCNQYLIDTGYLIKLEYDETYCAGVYFLSISCP